MYERGVDRNLARFNVFASLSLLASRLSSCLGSVSGYLFYLFIGLVDPVIESDSALCVFLYFVSQLQAWYQSLPQDVMKRGCTDSELLCYSPLFFVVADDPVGELIHLTLFSLVFMDKNTESRYGT